MPLFVANAVDNVISPQHEEGSSEDWDVPESLLGVIERQRARLASDTLSLLEAAAVCGVKFECSVVAGILRREAADVAKQCDELARHQTWLAPAGLGTLDDGTLDPRFVFRHALYRQAFYQRIALPQRAALHRGAAAVIERLKGGPTETTATLRALHYERGMDALGAMRAYAAAGVRALRRFAPREALLLAARGLVQLERSSQGEERLDAELGLQHLRSTALAQSTGVSNPDARASVHAQGLQAVTRRPRTRRLDQSRGFPHDRPTCRSQGRRRGQASTRIGGAPDATLGWSAPWRLHR